MTNEGFREYVNGNMLFWAANVRSTEGYRGTTVLGVNIVLSAVYKPRFCCNPFGYPFQLKGVVQKER